MIIIKIAIDLFDLFYFIAQENVFINIRQYATRNLKFILFGILLIGFWPTGFVGLAVFIVTICTEQGLYLMLDRPQRIQLGVIWSICTLNFIPLMFLTDDRPILKVLEKVIGEKIAEEFTKFLTELQQKNPKFFAGCVGVVVTGSVSYSGYYFGTGLRNLYIDNFHLDQAIARHTLLSEQLQDMLALKKAISMEFLAPDWEQKAVNLHTEKQTWAEIKYSWEIKKWR